jgi:hypothetical protein
MTGDKAPSPDGFAMAFFQKCWEVLKDDIINIFLKSPVIPKA